MSVKSSLQSLLEPVDDASSVELPPRFAEALQHVRSMVARCGQAGITHDTLTAALMTELMPRLIQAYGSHGVSVVLNQLAFDLASANPALTKRQ